jgi:geranylgeranyl diphosphate synthase type I
MDSAGPAQAELLRAGLGNRDLDEAGAAALCDVIVATGALERVEARIAERARRARAALDTSAISDEARGVLDGLAVRATERHT